MKKFKFIEDFDGEAVTYYIIKNDYFWMLGHDYNVNFKDVVNSFLLQAGSWDLDDSVDEKSFLNYSTDKIIFEFDELSELKEFKKQNAEYFIW